jgi:arsenate reductase
MIDYQELNYTLYGIPNCDTVKKAQNWLKQNNVAFRFHNYKTEGIERKKIEEWLNETTWEKLINKTSTTWKNLTAEQKAEVDGNESAIRLMLENPSVIKRPVLEADRLLAVGFKIDNYEKIFGIS